MSVLAALAAFYLFVRMRRAFHHELVMLLIQSDMMKALWLLISPIVYFTNGPVYPPGTFCQVSGFFLTASIEAADIAVLMIALHTALILIRPGRPGGGAGLYPYRRIAYFCWFTIPLALAAVVPLTGNKFVDDGPYCNLPASPAWYRLGLSWIPRYVIFLVILFTYIGIYLYVRFQLARFCRDQRRASGQNTSSCLFGLSSREECITGHPTSPPPIPHRTIRASTQATRTAEEEPRDRQISVASTITMLKQECQPVVPIPAQVARREPISWKPVNFSHGNMPETPSLSPHEAGVENDHPRTRSNATTCTVLPSSQGPRHDEAPPTPSRPSQQQQHQQEQEQQERQTQQPRPLLRRSRYLWRRSLSLGCDIDPQSVEESVYNIFDILRRRPPRAIQTENTAAATTETETETETDSIHLGTEGMGEVVRQSRDRMERSLRLLFVYPSIYVLAWIAPCISHAMGFDDDYAMSFNGNGSGGTGNDHSSVEAGVGVGGGGGNNHLPPYSLEVATVVSLCIGAAVDCCFFSAWEQPWRHLQRSFGEGLRMHLKFPAVVAAVASRGRSSSYDSGDYHHHLPRYHRRRGAGRTREERTRDARQAYLRRNQEAVERLAGAPTRGPLDQRPTREWWDRLDDYGMMINDDGAEYGAGMAGRSGPNSGGESLSPSNDATTPETIVNMGEEMGTAGGGGASKHA